MRNAATSELSNRRQIMLGAGKPPSGRTSLLQNTQHLSLPQDTLHHTGHIPTEGRQSHVSATEKGVEAKHGDNKHELMSKSLQATEEEKDKLP